MIHALAKIPLLHVPARTSSFALRDEKDLRAVGYKLNVQHIVEGSFRRFESKMRLTARLVNVHTGFEEWSASFDRDVRDIFALQVEIARTIAEALRVELAREPGPTPALARMTNIEVYELCLKGRYYWARRPLGIANAIQYFKQALELTLITPQPSPVSRTATTPSGHGKTARSRPAQSCPLACPMLRKL